MALSGSSSSPTGSAATTSASTAAAASCTRYWKPQEWYKNKGITGFWELAGLVPAPVPAQSFKDVLMTPTLIGMFQSGKFLPPQLNLVLELEFAEPADALRPG